MLLPIEQRIAAELGVQHRQIEAAVQLARTLDVKHLELRHERALAHPAFNALVTEKVHMRLALPATPELLWEKGIKSKLRSQIKRPLSMGMETRFGPDQLDAFYEVELPDVFAVQHPVGTVLGRVARDAVDGALAAATDGAHGAGLDGAGQRAANDRDRPAGRRRRCP